VRAVVAESFERIHRSNLIGMGVLPLQLREGATLEDLGIDGERAGASTFTIRGIAGADPGSLLGATLDVEVAPADGSDPPIMVPVTVRIDTPTEAAYYEHGGILPYVLRQHLASGA
jgi:aconitate hydratase